MKTLSHYNLYVLYKIVQFYLNYRWKKENLQLDLNQFGSIRHKNHLIWIFRFLAEFILFLNVRILVIKFNVIMQLQCYQLLKYITFK